MIYSVVGTHPQVRKEASALFSSFGAPRHILYRESVEQLESLVDGVSLFGEAIVVLCVGCMEREESKKEIERVLPRAVESPVIVIIDEPLGTLHTHGRLAKISKKIFNALEKKEKDVRVFAICNALAKRDKKEAWVAFMKVREAETGEAIAGALWWKWKSIWQDSLDGKRVPYTKDECERIGKELLLAPLRAHNGELDLMVEVERVILSI